MSTFAAIQILSLFGLVGGRSFLMNYPGVDPAYLNLAFGSDDGAIDVDLQAINATLLPLFEALPRNQDGQLATSLMRYVVKRYFSQRHGWIIRGFEPHTMLNSDDSTPAAPSIVNRKIPGYLEAVLDKMLSRQAFTMQDMIAIIASIETLIYDENLYAMQKAYRLNEMSLFDKLSKGQSMKDLMASYFMLEFLAGNSLNESEHSLDRSTIDGWYPHWQETEMLMTDIVEADRFERMSSVNPFSKQQSYAFEDIVRVSRTVGEQFGPFSNHECHDMKLKLADMDVHGTGRVRLADFYRGIGSDDSWQFSESSEELKAMGALDDSSGWLGPQVIIANYVGGQHNCITSSEYYSVCCLNECDGIFQHLEAHIRAPAASAAEIVQAIEGGISPSPLLSSTAPTEARNLSTALRTRLDEIASLHDDMIPLHGRLFAQWLHYAFPHECPYPHISGTVSSRKSDEIREPVTEDEVMQHIESEAGRHMPSPEAGRQMWHVHEELLTPRSSRGAGLMAFVRHLMLLMLLVSFAAIVLKEMKRLGCVAKHCRKDGPFASHDV